MRIGGDEYRALGSLDAPASLRCTHAILPPVDAQGGQEPRRRRLVDDLYAETPRTDIRGAKDALRRSWSDRLPSASLRAGRITPSPSHMVWYQPRGPKIFVPLIWLRLGLRESRAGRPWLWNAGQERTLVVKCAAPCTVHLAALSIVLGSPFARIAMSRWLWSCRRSLYPKQWATSMAQRWYGREM